MGLELWGYLIGTVICYFVMVGSWLVAWIIAEAGQWHRHR